MFSIRHILLAISAVGISGSIIGVASCAPARADYNPKEWAKYLNPLPQKQYLNKSQDRVIKKRAFKASDLPSITPIPNKEIGLFAQISTSDLHDDAALQKLLDDKRVAGLSALIPWASLEPTEEHYDWTPVDNLLSLCKSKNKSLILKISTCGLEATEFTELEADKSSADKSSQSTTNSDTPQWLYADGGVKSLTYQDKAGKDHKMPIFWDATYLAKWSNFVKVLGERYDKNPTLHSVGITGGGMLGSTLVVPDFRHEKANYEKLETELTKVHGMSQRQLVTHWKYVADLFPKAFPNTSLNFDIDPPTPNRAGQDTLDEISDYLVFRYGERVYLTRQNISNGKHGFEEYRVILKFKPDTFMGYQLTENVAPGDWKDLAKNALNDGVSFMEIPKKYFKSDDAQINDALTDLQDHLGFQLVLTSAKINSEIKSGEPLEAAISFINAGSTSPKAVSRQLDKDVPVSYQVGLEIRNQDGKPLMVSAQTPPVPTNKWIGNKPFSWSGTYRLTGLKPGDYTAFLCVVDKQSHKRLQIFDGTEGGANIPETEVALGKINVK